MITKAEISIVPLSLNITWCLNFRQCQ